MTRLCSLPLVILSWCALVIGLGGSTRLYGQPYDLSFEHIRATQGLPGSTVYSILQDRYGFIWVGTESGVAQYDGYEFVTYGIDSTRSHVGRNVLLEDRSGRLWIGLVSGLYRLDRDQQRVVKYSRADAERLTDVLAIAEGADGGLWIGTSHGLYRLNPETAAISHFSHDPDDPTSLSNDVVHDVLVGQDGSVWAGTRRGLNRLEEGSDAFTRFRHNPRDSLTVSHDLIRVLHEDRGGTLWIGTEEGLNRMDRETSTFTRYCHDPEDPSSLHRDRISAIYEGRGGELWVGTWGSTAGGTLHLMDRQAGTFTRYRHDAYDPQSLTRNYSITALHEDSSGVLWIGTGGGYLNKVDNIARRFVHYRPNPDDSGSLGRSFAFAVHEDQHGSVWIGMDNGLGRFDRRSAKYRQYELEARAGASEAHSRVLAVAEDHQNTIWIGAGSGLHTFSRDRQEITPVALSAPSDSEAVVYVTEIMEDRHHRLWIGTSTGLRRFDRSKGQLSAKVFGEIDGTPYVTAICQDRSGMLWIGTRGGLGRYDPEADQVRGLPPSIAHLRQISIASVLEDRTGAVWIGTKGDGLWKFSPRDSSSIRIGQQYGLASSTILNILEDDLGRIWVRTLTGISWYSSDESRFISYLQKRALGARLNEWGDMRENEAGEFIFAGDQGLVFFTPEHIVTNRVPPQVAITHFKVPGGCISSRPTGCRPIDGSLLREEKIRLAHNQNDISLDYVGLHFSNSEQNLYQYMLEPYDREWRAVGNQRRATYTNLPPGEYVFRVKAANADGIWSDGDTSLRIVIVPPFWNRTWFYLVCVLLALALAYFAYRLRVRHLRRHAAELARHVERRTRELRLEKKKTERQAQRLARLDHAKSRFFANVSHEFRTPLMLIMSPLQDLLDGDFGELSRDVKARVSTMLSNARRLLHLINELLDLAKLESGEMKLQKRSGEFVTFLRHLVQSFAPLAEHRQITLRFKSRIERGIYPSAFDEHKLEKVFSNLLSNALKFTPEGGKVWVMLTESSDGESPGIEVVVKDTGPGIPKEHLSAVFDRFRQSNNANRSDGIGLGLAIAKELVELHGGTILVESELGFGSVFIVRLPLRIEDGQEWCGGGDGQAAADPARLDLSLEEPPTAERSDERAADAGPAAASDARETVLVVDDNAHVRNYLREHLETRYRVVEAQDGLSAIETAREHRPDLILCDVMIPGIDGFEVCKRVKQDPDLRLIPILLLTARADVDDRVCGIESGADDYVSKPFDMRELLARIDSLTRSRRTMRKAFSRQIVVEPSGVSAASEDEAFLRDVMAVMEARMSDSTFNVEALANELGLSRRHLYRKLHALLNESSAEFMRRVRLERAKQLLLAGRLSVSEVAYRVGYSSGSNFARSFRDYYDISPTECTEQAAEEGRCH